METLQIETGGNVIDWEQLIRRLGGDEQLAAEVIPGFLADNRERLDMLAAAVKTGDAKAVKQYAHALKGASATIGAMHLPETANRLEIAGREEDVSQFEPLFEELRREFDELDSFLSKANWIDLAKQQPSETEPVKQS